MKFLTDVLIVSDRYERKARLRPALLAVLPLSLAAAWPLTAQAEWSSTLGVGALIHLALAVMVGHLARAAGVRVERRFVAEHGGLPTNRWLRPTDATKSEQQRRQWYDAIRRLTGFDIEASALTSAEECDRVIADATRRARDLVRERPEAKLVAIHNEDYGFVRNLQGLMPLWLASCAIGAIACLIQAIWLEASWVGVAIELVLLGAALLLRQALPGYVEHASNRYAESLLAAMVAIAEREEATAPATTA